MLSNVLTISKKISRIYLCNLVIEQCSMNTLLIRSLHRSLHCFFSTISSLLSSSSDYSSTLPEVEIVGKYLLLILVCSTGCKKTIVPTTTQCSRSYGLSHLANRNFIVHQRFISVTYVCLRDSLMKQFHIESQWFKRPKKIGPVFFVLKSFSFVFGYIIYLIHMTHLSE